MDVTILAEEARTYQVWAAVGNSLSRDGVTVDFALEDEGSVSMDFPSRADAIVFFRALLDAAERAALGESGSPETLMTNGSING